MFRVEILFSWYNTWNTLQYKQENKFFMVFKLESWLAENILQCFATRAARWHERRCLMQKYVFSWEFLLVYFKLFALRHLSYLGLWQHSSGLHHLRSIYTSKVLLHFWKQEKSPMVPGPVCTEDAWRCSNGIVHWARLVCRAVCERALSCNRTIRHES